MADNNKEVVRVLKDIASELHQLNRGISNVANAIDLKQFEDLDPPPRGTVIQNFKGTTVMNTIDFEEMENGEAEED